ncbi:hypothetical protein BBO99_00002511 [Phytophthora kernoviae]|uniref:Thioredoxin domain-containing protein n=1 Tax=Phytophthora kernoviae TaxID=325452 RepID=A0A3R7G555_9STRA|nr:hypothetical protein JM16_004683 [Phytophthora kernoviae]KAG2530619.1 hypothetical protein JM18_002047 [Phytophthora kernoviae]RLN36805.1 hypothetical protein BBI17_002397 [Phytophthora kernoviae]RLN82931.1 hypothetical protein BBO99_00002511 [Phytophthora kernoviae]
MVARLDPVHATFEGSAIPVVTTEPVRAFETPAIPVSTKEPVRSFADRHDVVSGYNAAMTYLANYTIPEGSDEQVYLFFTCGDDKGKQTTWRQMCGDASKIVYDIFAKSPSRNRLVTIHAGDKAYWSSPNAFFHDGDLRVKAIPSIMQWHGGRPGAKRATSGMIIEDGLLYEPLLRYLFKNVDVPDPLLAPATIATKEIIQLKGHSAYRSYMDGMAAGNPLSPLPEGPIFLFLIAGRIESNDRPWCPYCRYSEISVEYAFYAFAPKGARLVRVETVDSYKEWKNPVNNAWKGDTDLMIRGVPWMYRANFDAEGHRFTLRRFGSEKSTTAQMAKEIHEMHEQVVTTKQKRYGHSEMSSNKGNALLQDLNIRVKPVGTVPFAARDPAPVQAFIWESICDGRGKNIALTEEQQRERYREYVEGKIGDVLADKKLCVLGVEKVKNNLSAAVPGHDVDLVGHTGILVLSALVKKFPHYVELLPDVKMLIEVKRVVKAGSGFQVLSELIALGFLVDGPVMALLTNLTNHWQFFWVSEKKNNYAIIQTTTITEPGEAFEMIRTLSNLRKVSNPVVVNGDGALDVEIAAQQEEQLKEQERARQIPIKIVLSTPKPEEPQTDTPTAAAVPTEDPTMQQHQETLQEKIAAAGDLEGRVPGMPLQTEEAVERREEAVQVTEQVKATELATAAVPVVERIESPEGVNPVANFVPFEQRHQVISGYQNTMRFLENYQYNPDESLFLLFMCSDEQFNAGDWSEECVEGKKHVYDVFSKSPGRNKLVTVLAGSQKYWKYQNDFYNDADLRVKGVPCLMRWEGQSGRTSGMLVQKTLYSEPFLRYLFLNTDQPEVLFSTEAIKTKKITTIHGYKAYQSAMETFKREENPGATFLMMVSGRFRNNNRPWCPYCRYSELPIEYAFYSYAPKNARIFRVEVTDSYSEWKHRNEFSRDPDLQLKFVPLMLEIQQVHAASPNASKTIKYTPHKVRYDELASLRELFSRYT